MTYKWGFLISVVLLLAAIGFMALTLAAGYRQQRISLTTFDNSDYYNAPLPQTFAEPRTLILFGDSRVKHWRPPPTIKATNILNRGIPGETTAQMRLRFEKDVLDIDPDFVVIQAGINDLVAASMADAELKATIVQHTINNLTSMVDSARQQNRHVILTTIVEPYRLDLLRFLIWGNDLTELVQHVNKALAALDGTPNVQILDTNKVLRQSDGQWQANVNKDALHFTGRAYDLLNQALVQLINSP